VILRRSTPKALRGSNTTEQHQAETYAQGSLSNKSVKTSLHLIDPEMQNS
jgi:hypothetical protein